MIYRITYTTPEGLQFPVDIEAPDEERARFTWQHRHPEAFGYRLVSVAPVVDAVQAHLRWADCAAEFASGARSPLVRSVEMGLLILIIIGYVLTMFLGTGLGLWLGTKQTQVSSMAMGLLGMGVGTLLGYSCNVLLDWLRVMIALQLEVLMQRQGQFSAEKSS